MSLFKTRKRWLLIECPMVSQKSKQEVHIQLTGLSDLFLNMKKLS